MVSHLNPSPYPAFLIIEHCAERVWKERGTPTWIALCRCIEASASTCCHMIARRTMKSSIGRTPESFGMCVTSRPVVSISPRAAFNSPAGAEIGRRIITSRKRTCVPKAAFDVKRRQQLEWGTHHDVPSLAARGMSILFPRMRKGVVAKASVLSSACTVRACAQREALSGTVAASNITAKPAIALC